MCKMFVTVPKGVPGITLPPSARSVCPAISFSWSKQLLKSTSLSPSPREPSRWSRPQLTAYRSCSSPPAARDMVTLDTEAATVALHGVSLPDLVASSPWLGGLCVLVHTSSPTGPGPCPDLLAGGRLPLMWGCLRGSQTAGGRNGIPTPSRRGVSLQFTQWPCP